MYFYYKLEFCRRRKKYLSGGTPRNVLRHVLLSGIKEATLALPNVRTVTGRSQLLKINTFFIKGFNENCNIWFRSVTTNRLYSIVYPPSKARATNSGYRSGVTQCFLEVLAARFQCRRPGGRRSSKE